MAIKYLATGSVVLKALVMTIIVSALGTTFFQSIILVTVSGAITGGAVVLAAVLTTRAVRADREVLHDIKRKVGASKREADKEETE